jgi:hypothetical protein
VVGPDSAQAAVLDSDRVGNSESEEHVPVGTEATEARVRRRQLSEGDLLKCSGDELAVGHS